MTANELQPGQPLWTYLEWEVVPCKVRNRAADDNRWFVEIGGRVQLLREWYLFASREEAAVAMFEAAQNVDANLTERLADLTLRRDAARAVAAGHLGEKT